MSKLSDWITLKQRYFRSINLERDLDDIDSVAGYIPTARSLEAFNRFFRAYSTPNTVRAWTITSVYGTGKSAFANFLTSLSAEATSPARKAAEKTLRSIGMVEEDRWLSFQNAMPEKGLLRAVTVAQREPISHTIIRALYNGASKYWNVGKKPDLYQQVEKLYHETVDNPAFESPQVLKLVIDLARKTQGGLLLVIDELGKNLEYITEHQSETDLFLLQQIAELPSDKNSPKIFVFGLLHQSFAGYASRLSTLQRNEWTKIQGRFEDISFTESTEQVVNLIAQAIEHKQENDFQTRLRDWEAGWISILRHVSDCFPWNEGQLQKVFPLHPISVQVLPVLCQKYAQNDRSLFTFLAGSEPFSLPSFLNSHHWKTSSKTTEIQTLKLHDLYDYFVESVGIISQPKHTRWIEVHSRITEATGQTSDEVKALKTIGILNLVNNPKAGMAVVVLALCSDPANKEEKTQWERVIKGLIDKSFVTWRKRIDELRIWEGSDFEIEAAVKTEVEKLQNSSYAYLLNKLYPLSPLVAQRHSYQTGTLRYFECEYADHSTDLTRLTSNDPSSDGKILYWVDLQKEISLFPESTVEDKPLVIIASENIEAFQQALLDYIALKKVASEATQLTTDGVARKEVKQRLVGSKRLLDHLFHQTFYLPSPSVYCWINDERVSFRKESEFNKALSVVLDDCYKKGLTCWNELINRRRLSPNSVRARRELMTAMLENGEKEGLGLDGYGPDVNIYRSLLLKPGIHREIEGEWCFTDPDPESGIYPVWERIEEYCISAQESTKSISDLIDELKKVPYGIKDGPIPVLITAVLMKHADDIGLYYNDRYLPTVEPEQLDFLTRFPARYSVKCFDIEGEKAQFFEAVEEVFEGSAITNRNLRNAKLLGNVAPLIRIVKSLPPYSIQTRELSDQAIAVREAVLQMTEPDQMLFKDLPEACGFL